MYICICHGSHLSFLDRADATLGVENEYGDIRLAPQPVNSCAACITTGRTHDGQRLSFLSRRFCLVAALEKVGEEVAQELECNILEGIRRTMEKLEDVLVGGEWLERGDIGMAPCRIVVRRMYKGSEVCLRYLICRDEEGEDLDAELWKSLVRPGILPVRWELWY